MKDGRIADDQIIMSNSLNDYKPRLNNGNLWCGKYEFGEVHVTIKFKSIFKITGVNFNGTDKRRANRFRIAYYSAVMGTRHFQYKVLHILYCLQFLRNTTVLNKTQFKLHW